MALEVTVEAIVKPWKYVPLKLTNGNSLSLMADVAMHMPVWKSNFGRPTPSTRCCPYNCVCSMA